MRAMLLAAGRGSRLGVLTEERAKPAVPFANRPMAAVALGALARGGAREVMVNTHHLPQTVEAALRRAAPATMTLRFHNEPQLLGTGGGVAAVAEWLAEPGEPVVLMNSDVLFEPDLTAVVAAHREAGAWATMVVREDPRARDFGAVWTREGRVVGIDGTTAPRHEGRGEPHVFTGVHVLSPECLQTLPTSGCIVREGYAPWLNAGCHVGAWVSHEPWEDLGTPRRYLAAHGRHDGTRVHAEAQVHPDAELDGTWVGAGAKVGPVRLRNVVVWDGARVDEPLENAVVTTDGRVVTVAP